MIWKNFAPEELKRQYSPSSVVDNFDELVAAYATRSKASEASVEVIGNIRYGDHEDERLDLFPAGAPDAPLMVFIHGGYWQALSKSDSTFAGAGFVRQGIAFAAIDYSIAPKGTIEQMVDQCVNSLVWLYENAGQFGYAREKIYLSGSSAGAHLAAMAMIRLRQMNVDQASPLVKGCVLMSGIYDLRPLLDTYVNEPLNLNEKRASDLSPILLGLEALPGAIVCWGENETDEFKRQSRDFADALITAGSDCDHFEIAGCNHFDIVHQLEKTRIESGRLILQTD
jgi:arylformamidase